MGLEFDEKMCCKIEKQRSIFMRDELWNLLKEKSRETRISISRLIRESVQSNLFKNSEEKNGS